MSEAPEQPAPSTEPAPSTATPAPEPTLEDVFNEYKVEQTQPEREQYVPQERQNHEPRQPQQAVPDMHVPDPALDPDGFRRYEAAKAQESQVLRQAVQRLDQELSQSRADRIRAKEEADIAKAVGNLKEKAPNVDEDMLQIWLAHEAKKDPRLLSVWNGRDKNPKAWDAALKVLGNKVAGRFQILADPQLTENQRAMKASQSHMATAQPQPSKEERMGQLQGAAFDREWERIKSG